MDAEAIRSHHGFGGRWYYRIELAPGLYTPGRDHGAVARTRELLQRVDVEGTRCLDIGTQEGIVPVLLRRRHASEVVAYDITLRKAQLALVQQALGTQFELIGGMGLRDLPSTGPCDVVVFSGVLYHMLDPLSGLANVRGLVRNGGICLVETMVAFEDTLSMHFNAGRYSPHALWVATPRCLDYMLRWLRLEPLDVIYVGAGDGPGRLAAACRAVSEPVADRGDEWIVTSQRQKGTRVESLDWEAVATDADPIGYEARDGLIRRESGSVDLHASVSANDPYAVDSERMRLNLEDSF